MGSWDGTCGVTQLSISHEDKVRGFILVPKWGGHMMSYYKDQPFSEVDPFLGGGTTYAHDAYHPLTLSIKGVYNDYGSMHYITEDANTKAIIAYINLTQKTHYTDIQTVIDDITTKDLPFGLMMVHESIFQAGVKAAQEGSVLGGDNRLRLKSLTEEVKLAIRYITKSQLIDFVSMLGIESADKIAFMQSGYGWGGRLPKRRLSRNNFIEDYFVPSTGYMDFGFAQSQFKAILCSKNTAISDIVKHTMFCSFMDSARKTWVSQTGCGSQGDNYLVTKRLGEATKAFLQLKKKENAKEFNLKNSTERRHFNIHWGIKAKKKPTKRKVKK